jgi:hypothetical protein
MKKTLMFSVLVAALSAMASGDIIVTLNSPPVVNGSNFDWTYTATLKSGSSLMNGDFFTIDDIGGGFGPGTPIANPVIMPGSDWSSSIQLIGIDGFNQAPPEISTLYNLTFTFIGSSPVVASADTILGGGAGAFGYTSSVDLPVMSVFSATSHSTIDGFIQGNTSSLAVADPPVPEPATMILSGGGLIVLGVLRCRRSKV